MKSKPIGEDAKGTKVPMLGDFPLDNKLNTKILYNKSKE